METENKIATRKLLTEASDPTIKDLCDRLTENRLIAKADFQRKYVWKNRTVLKSKLIESVFLRVPIPIIYTAETDEDKEEVVDGQQRLLTFQSFLRSEFVLNKLDILNDLNGRTYKTLPEKPLNLKAAFNNYPIRVIKILKESNENTKFDIFERLNRGSVKLNEQELRNCIYRGNFNNLLKELVQNKTFLTLQNLDEPHTRMVDAERILRFFAFCDLSERKFKSPLKGFLNNYIKKKREIEQDEITEKTNLFNKSVELCADVFGDHAFKRWRLYTKLNEHYLNGDWDGSINEGIFDIQMYGFTQYEKRDIIGKAQVIKDHFIDLCCDDAFIEKIAIGTYDTERVKNRTERWFAILRDIVGYPSNDRRLYTYEEKKQLFESENGNICGICKNSIRSIDDAHVDHINRFADGGKTVIGNAQLTHRFCNISKG